MEDNTKEEEYKKYYEQGEVIGSGSFGLVYKGKDKSNNEPIAIKIIDYEKIIMNESNENDDIENILNTYIDGFINEFENMKICSKDNI